MAEKFKLDHDGNCPTCEKLAGPNEAVLCFLCKSHFHGVCSIATKEEKIGTQTMITNYLLASTKENFKFFCDKCATNLEISLAGSDGQRMNLMESRMDSINTQLEEIKKLVCSERTVEKAECDKNKQEKVPSTSIWNDPERLANVKAPPAGAALVVPANQDKQLDTTNRSIIEKTVLESSIPVRDSFTNQAGELVLLCDSAEQRDELKNLVKTAKDDINLTTPKVKRSAITIVGLMRECTSEDVIQMLQKIDLIKKFANLNNIADHFQFHTTKPLRNKQDCYQVYATVSQVLREGITKLKDKLVMGINSCKVYDRKLIKRCFNCQKFGHFAADCSAPQTPACAKCSGNHSTRDCTSNATGCINCKRLNLDYKTHNASYHSCPALQRFEEQQKKPRNHLNSARTGESSRR